MSKKLPFEASLKGDCCVRVTATGVTWSELVGKAVDVVLVRLTVSHVFEGRRVVDTINKLSNKVRECTKFYKA